MENESSQVASTISPNTNPSQQTIQSQVPLSQTPKSKVPFIFVGIVLAILALCGSYILGARSNQKSTNIIPSKNKPSIAIATVAPSVTSGIPPTISIPVNDWNSRDIKKVNWGDWKSFKISYPSSWSLETNRASYSDMENLEVYLKKGTYTMKFLQAPSDAGSCLYPEDTPFMGMVEEYASYTEIPKTNGIIWRNSKLKNYQSNFPGYTICEKNSGRNTFVGMTSIGIINLLDTSNTFSAETINEVNEILRKIEITN